VSRFSSRLKELAAKHPRALGIALVVGLGIGLAGYAAGARSGGPETVKVRRGDLALGVEVDGELVAIRSLDLGPPVVRDTWEYKISFMAAEGANVKKGQPVVGFDASSLTRQLDEKRAERDEAQKRIERKEVEVVAQRRDLELQLEEAAARLEKARLKDDVPQDLRARNEVLQTELDLKGAQDESRNLKQRIAALESSQQASLRSLVAQRDRAVSRVSDLEASIEAMTVRATQDGIVIYKTGWRDEKKKIGDSAWFGEKLLQLPDLSQMRADGDVDESDGGTVREGQRVTLRLEALPDRDFSGKLIKIARSVRRKSWRVPNKVFRVQVALDQSDAAFRPAMRFRGEIETKKLTSVLLVPREAVVLRPGGPIAWVKRWNGFREVKLELGRHNKRLVEVTAGLAEGDLVATSDPRPDERS